MKNLFLIYIVFLTNIITAQEAIKPAYKFKNRLFDIQQMKLVDSNLIKQYVIIENKNIPPIYYTGGNILDKNNNKKGTISFDKKKMDIIINNKKWSIENTSYDNAGQGIIIDSILVIASYNSMSTGSQVNAYNAYSGVLLWKGEVKQLNVGHSEYYNTVYITLHNRKIIVEGNEAHGDYLQVLDLKTGKNLFSEMPKMN